MARPMFVASDCCGTFGAALGGPATTPECGGEKEGMTMLVAVLSERFRADLPAIEWVRACDLQPKVLEFLEHMAASGGGEPFCIFENILDRLPPVAKDWTAAAMPKAGSSAAQKASAMTAIQEWLFDNRGWIFSSESSSWCRSHQCDCTVSAKAKWMQCQGLRGQSVGRTVGRSAHQPTNQPAHPLTRPPTLTPHTCPVHPPTRLPRRATAANVL